MPRNVELADRQQSSPLLDAGGVASVPLPAVADAGAMYSAVRSAEHSDSATRSPGWSRTIGRLVAYVAAAFAIITVVPLVSLQLDGNHMIFDQANVKARLAGVETLRPLRMTPDASITATRAGAAMHALFPTSAKNDFVVRPTQRLNWPTAAFGATLFADARTPQWWGPDATKVIMRVAKRVSPEELRFLEIMSSAPAWPLVDEAGRAAHADIVGGRFVTPFAPTVSAVAMPIPQFGDAKIVAHASVTRAAYFVARGDYAQAELVLRNAMGVAFLLIDDGPAVIDALVGRVMLGIVADGLAQLYAVTGNREGEAIVSQFLTRARNTARSSVSGGAPTVAEWRGALQRDIADETLPRSVRFEQLRALHWSRCASPVQLLLQTFPEIEAANDAARRTLAVTSAERALVDLLAQTPGTLREAHVAPPAIAAAAAQVVSAVTGREEFATCTRILSGLR